MPPRVQRDAEAPAGGPVVSGFAGEGFRVGDRVFEGGLLMTPEWARGWTAPPLVALCRTDLAELLAFAPLPEFILLGTGATMVRPPVALVAEIERDGVGIEPMDSRAAARLWGILRGEGRWIAAALLPLGAKSATDH